MIGNLLSYKKIIFVSLVTTLILLTPTIALAQNEVSQEAGLTILQSLIWGLVAAVFGNLAGLAGVLLNTSVETFIIGFGKMYTSGGVGQAVDTVWVSVRDFFNITFIFGIVYIGFKMILGINDSQTKTWLVKLIMAALLVNFSLYITKFVIDISNIVATEIAVASFQYDDGFDKQIGVSNAFMNQMGLTGLFATPESGVTADQGWGFVFGGMILFIVMIFVFGAGALLILIRYAVLILYMIFSPFMFIGWVFPQFQQYTNKFWSDFLGRAFFAPMYLFLLAVSAQVVSAMFKAAEVENGVVRTESVFSASGEEILRGATSANGLPGFAIACIFLVASLLVAQKMGAVGGDTVISAGKRTGRVAQRFALRNTVGYGARGVNALSQGALNRYREVDATMNETGRGRAARRALSVLSLGALTDRNVEGALNAGTRLSVAGSETQTEAEQRVRSRTSRQNQTTGDRDRRESLDNAIQALNNNSSTEAQLTTNLELLARTIRDTSNQQLERMNVDQLTDRRVAHNITDNQIRHLEQSGRFSAQEINNIRNARRESFISIAASGSNVNTLTPDPANPGQNITTFNNPNIDPTIAGNQSDSFSAAQRQNLMSGNVQRVGEMPAAVFTAPDMARYIRPQALAERMRNGMTGAEIERVRRNIDEYITNPTTPLTEEDRLKEIWRSWVANSNGLGAQLNLQSI